MVLDVLEDIVERIMGNMFVEKKNNVGRTEEDIFKPCSCEGW